MCKSWRMATTLPLIGSAEACELLGIDRSTLSRRVARGEITPAQKMPGETGPFLFQRDEIERVLADHAGQAEAASA